MEKKDIKPMMRVKHPETLWCGAGTGLVDKDFEGKTGKILVGVGTGSLFFDAKDLEVA